MGACCGGAAGGGAPQQTSAGNKPAAVTRVHTKKRLEPTRKKKKTSDSKDKKTPAGAERPSYNVGRQRIYYLLPEKVAKAHPKNLKPKEELQMEHVFGYNGRDARQNAFWTATGEIVYHVAAIGVVHNLSSNKQRFFLSHNEDIVCLAMHPGRHIVATGQQDPKGKGTPYICVWDTRAPVTQLAKITYHDRAVSALAFSADGNKLISVGNEDTREGALWDWKEEGKKKHNSDSAASQPLHKFIVSKDTVYGIHCSPQITDKALYAITVGPSLCKLWHAVQDAATAGQRGSSWSFKARQAKTLNQTKAAQRKYHAVAFMPDGSYSLVGTEMGLVCLFTLPNFDLAAHAQVGKGRVSAVCSVGQDGFLAACGNDLFKYQVKAGKLLKPSAHYRFDNNTEVRSLDQDPKSQQILIGTGKAGLFTLSADLKTLTRMVKGHAKDILKCAMHPKLPEVATGGKDKILRVYNYEKYSHVRAKVLSQAVFSIEYNRDGSMIAVGLENGSVSLITDVTMTEVNFPVGKEQINALRFTSTDNTLLCGSDDNVLYVVDVPSKTVTHKLQGHTSAISCLMLSSDDAMAMTNSKDYEILYWDLAQKARQDFQDPDVDWVGWKNLLGWPVVGIFHNASDGTDVNSVALRGSYARLAAGGSELLATGDDFGRVNLYRAPVLEQKNPAVKSYGGHSSFVTCVDFSTDGHKLISCGGHDLAVVVWGVQTPS